MSRIEVTFFLVVSVLATALLVLLSLVAPDFLLKPRISVAGLAVVGSISVAMTAAWALVSKEPWTFSPRACLRTFSVVVVGATLLVMIFDLVS